MINYDMEQFLGLDEPAEGGSTESGCVRIRMISDLMKHNKSSDKPSPLVTVLREGRGAKATDLRDKVFGVMGISDQVVYPDYRRPVADVYREAFLHCLAERSGVVHQLSCVDHEQPPLGTPSWVPVWSLPRRIFALLLDTVNGGSPCFLDQPQSKRKLTLKSLESRRPHRIYRETQIAYKAAVRNRIFGVTAKRYMGLLPRGTQIGDLVCVFNGAPTPCVLRRRLDNDGYLLLGECYVHGIMDGEILQMESIEWRDIVIA